jgi:hypothetical protein
LRAIDRRLERPLNSPVETATRWVWRVAQDPEACAMSVTRS